MTLLSTSNTEPPVLDCPTPSKLSYLSKREAKRQARRSHAQQRLRVYPCVCGHWHMTGQPKRTIA